jgi:hypothetical protein
VCLPGAADSPHSQAIQKQTTYQATLQALREWWESANNDMGGGGSHGGEGGTSAGTGTLFRPGVRSGRAAGMPGLGGSVPAGSGPAGGSLGKSKQDVARIAAEEWRAAGTGIAGIMANVKEE